MRPVGSEVPLVMRAGPTLIDLRQLLPQPYAAFGGFLGRVLGAEGINRIYDEATAPEEEDGFFAACLKSIGVEVRISDEDRNRLETPGSMVIVCNHPFGVVDALAISAQLIAVRPDVKIMANYLLGHVPEARPYLIEVDPFGAASSSARNLRPMREALEVLRGGGCLLTFPAGEVARLRPTGGGVIDPPWRSHIATLVKHSEASVLPVHIDGRNSLWFQSLGMLHPKIRTAMLAREVLNKKGKTVRITVGKPVPWSRLEPLEDKEARIGYLRMRTFVLRNRDRSKQELAMDEPAEVPELCPSEPECGSTELQAEVDALPASVCSLEQGDFRLFVVEAQQIPMVLLEIGRQREITFREVGEGTGGASDVDLFDSYYLHAFLWDDAASELVGAYRLGRTEQILASRGQEGLYTHTLFEYSPEFLGQLRGGALELGRSFITSRYQRKHSSLALLWKGILRWLSTEAPDCRILFGPVSISEEYNAFSKNLIVQYLRRKITNPEISAYVKPRHPFRARRLFGLSKRDIAENLRGIEDVSALISEVEEDGKGVPVLIKHYLKMSATLLSFNVDPQFSNVLDGLLLSDLTKVDPNLLGLYMGKERAAEYLERHLGLGEGNRGGPS